VVWRRDLPAARRSAAMCLDTSGVPCCSGGPANLLAALRVAASSQARGLGCLVAFADEIHTARHVRKTHASSITAFASQPGPIGYLAEDQVHIPMRPRRGPTVTGVDSARQPQVSVIPAVLGDDGQLLATIVEQVDGLVIAAFGVGHVPAAWVPPLAKAATRIPVVLASRTGAGSVLTKTYGFAGSESDLLSRGLISAGSLDPYKARILLRLLLSSDAGHTDVAKAFLRV
jgi:L-asparaginase